MGWEPTRYMVEPIEYQVEAHHTHHGYPMRAQWVLTAYRVGAHPILVSTSHALGGYPPCSIWVLPRVMAVAGAAMAKRKKHTN